MPIIIAYLKSSYLGAKVYHLNNDTLIMNNGKQ